VNTQLVAERLISTPEDMHQLGLALANRLRAGDFLVLTGLLGAGKTTLTRGIGEGLQAVGTVSSPTFVIARTHRTEGGNVNLVHVDAYRLGSPAEFDDLDIDVEGSITIVEWGRGLAEGLVESWLEVEIDRQAASAADIDDARQVRMTGYGPRWQGVTL
jgi:tRNA threonylcarbamoyladenosine biosynthesis protein TsaE